MFSPFMKKIFILILFTEKIQCRNVEGKGEKICPLQSPHLGTLLQFSKHLQIYAYLHICDISIHEHTYSNFYINRGSSIDPLTKGCWACYPCSFPSQLLFNFVFLDSQQLLLNGKIMSSSTMCLLLTQQEKIEFTNKTEKTGVLLDSEKCFIHFHGAMIFN